MSAFIHKKKIFPEAKPEQKIEPRRRKTRGQGLSRKQPGSGVLALALTVAAAGLTAGLLWWRLLVPHIRPLLERLRLAPEQAAVWEPLIAGAWMFCAVFAALLWKAGGMRSAFRDLEKLLRDERKQALSLIDLSDGFCVGLDLLHNIVAINRKGCEVLGFPRDRLIGKNWFHPFVSPVVRQAIKEEFFDIPEGHEDFLTRLRFPIVLRNGGEKIFDWKILRLADERGQAYALLCYGAEVAAEATAGESPSGHQPPDNEDLAELEQDFRALAAELDARKARIIELNTALEAAQRKQNEALTERASDSGNWLTERAALEAKITELGGELQAGKTRIAELATALETEQVAQNRASLAHEIETRCWQSERASLETRIRELTAALEAGKARLSELTTILEAEQRAQSGAHSAHELESKRWQAERAELESKIRELSALVETWPGEEEKTSLHFLEREVEDLRSKLKTLDASEGEARRALAEERAARSGDDTAFRNLRDLWKREKAELTERLAQARKKLQADADSRRLLEEELRNIRSEHERSVQRLLAEMEADRRDVETQRREVESERRDLRAKIENRERELAQLRSCQQATEQKLLERAAELEQELVKQRGENAERRILRSELSEAEKTRERAKDVQERYQAIEEHSGLFIVQLLPGGGVADFNAATASVLGWPRATTVGQNFYSLILPPEACEGLARRVSAELQGGVTARIDCALDFGDNSIHIIRWTLVGDGGTASLAIGRDITDLRRITDAQKENRRFLQELMSRSGDGYIRLDEHGGILELNPAAELLFGVTANSVYRQNIERLLPQSGIGDPLRLQDRAAQCARARADTGEPVLHARLGSGEELALWIGEIVQDSRREFLCHLRRRSAEDTAPAPLRASRMQ